jgi:hypothetical protein
MEALCIQLRVVTKRKSEFSIDKDVIRMSSNAALMFQQNTDDCLVASCRENATFPSLR